MKLRNSIVLVLVAALGFAQGISTVQAGEVGLYQWQLSRLDALESSPRQQSQRILIVDSVKDRDVDRFMNTRFEMIDRVMFTNVLVTGKDGKPRRNKKTGRYLTEDDGC